MKKKIATVVGARPQFVKAAALSRHLRLAFEEVLIHTGQHFDRNMSDIFFQEMAMPEPDHHLETSGGGHGQQTGRMMERLEQVFEELKPDLVLVYGDTNSTLAGALTAAKLHIPVAHVEAGLRSFNRKMPEEINRLLTDHLSQWLFVPSQSAMAHLKREAVVDGVHLVGDVMLDILEVIRPKLEEEATQVLKRLELQHGDYYYLTLHRAENVDDKARLASLFEALGSLAKTCLLPLHPRTKSRLEAFMLNLPQNIKVIEPLGHTASLALAMASELVLTDSGGLQKEAYFLGRPCITLRTETEWLETLEVGWNALGDIERLSEQVARMSHVTEKARPPIYGDGQAGEKICELLKAGV